MGFSSQLVCHSRLEHHSVQQRVMGSIPDQGTYPGRGFYPWLGHVQEAADQCFLHHCFSFSPFFSPFLSSQINERKHTPWWGLKKKKRNLIFIAFLSFYFLQDFPGNLAMMMLIITVNIFSSLYVPDTVLRLYIHLFTWFLKHTYPNYLKCHYKKKKKPACYHSALYSDWLKRQINYWY